MVKKLITIAITSGLLLTACSNDNEQMNDSQHQSHNDNQSTIPEDMQKSTNGKFQKGDKIQIITDHMSGMKNAKGIVKQAYKTHVYEVNYKPKNGDKEVKNHKWVVNEEIENAKQHGFEKGDSVKLEADHMPGMKGAIAEIDKVKDTTVYVVDYKNTKNDKWVKNHKWMTDEELKDR